MGTPSGTDAVFNSQGQFIRWKTPAEVASGAPVLVTGGPAPAQGPVPKAQTYTSPNVGFQTTTPGFNGNDGASPGYGTQSPNFLGTGQYVAPLMPINDQAITGNPTQGAAQNYGLNDVWGKLNHEIANAPNQGAQMANASQVAPASYSAATGTAAQGNASSYQAAQGNAAQGAATYGQAAQINGPAQGGYALSGPVGISTAGDRGWQGQQHGLAQTLQTQANGGGVSAADLQLARGGEQNIAGQLAILGSQRGSTNAALAQRSAADQGMAIQAQTNQQLGIQRAQEIAQAQGALGNVLGQARGQSQNYNLNAAQIAQQTALQNAQNAQAAALANTGYRQQVGVENAQLAQQQVLANQQSGNAMTGLNLGNLQQSNLTNEAALNAAYSQNSQQAQGMTGANMGAQNAMTAGNLSALNAANLGNAQLGQQGNLANQGASDQVTLANQNTQSSNANLQNQIVQSGLGAQTGIAEGSRAAGLSDQQLQLQQMLATGQINEQAYAAASQGNANLAGAVVGGGAALLSKVADAAGKTGSSTSTPANVTDPTLPGGANDVGFAGSLPTSRVPLNLFGSSSTPQPQKVASLQAVSDENLKTGIEGGNPMMRSYLNSYRDATATKEPTVNVTEGQRFQNPTYGETAGSGGSAGGGVGKAVGTAAGAFAGSFIPVPVLGTALGGFVGGLFGSALDGSGSPGTAGGKVPTSQGSGITIDESGWGQQNGDPNAALPPGYADAVSDENEKSAVTSGNRGMQAFLEQANVQQGAESNQGAHSNAFMQDGGPPSAHVDTKLPPWLTGNASQAQAYASPQSWQQDPEVGYGQQQPWQSPGMAGMQTGSGNTMGGIYGGGVTDAGGSVGGGFTGGGVYGGGVSSAGGYNAGRFFAGGNQLPGDNGGWTPGGGGFGSFTPNPQGPITESGMTALHNQPFTLNAPSPAGFTFNGVPGTSPSDRAASPTDGMNLSGGIFGDNYQAPDLAAVGKNWSGLGSGITMSDENEKQGVAPAQGNIQDMLDQLHAYQYRYKDPSMPGASPGKHLGVMAQDLEKSPIGAQFVNTGPDGAKRVNYGQALGAQWAGLATLNDRLDSHEAMLKQLTGKK